MQTYKKLNLHLGLFFAFLTETSVKVLPSLNIKHLQQAVGTHLILLRQKCNDVHSIYIHATAQAGEHKVTSYYFLNI